MNVTRLPEAVQTYRDGHPEKFDKLLPKRPGCLTSDSAIERGLKLLSRSIGDDSLVFLPYYQASGWVSIRAVFGKSNVKLMWISIHRSRSGMTTLWPTISL